jgi:hypothetical protein
MIATADKYFINTVACQTCGETLAYTFDAEKLPPQNTEHYCYLCIHSIVDVARILDVPQIPTHHDIYHEQQESTAEDGQRRNKVKLRSIIRSWFAKKQPK